MSAIIDLLAGVCVFLGAASALLILHVFFVHRDLRILKTQVAELDKKIPSRSVVHPPENILRTRR